MTRLTALPVAILALASQTLAAPAPAISRALRSRADVQTFEAEDAKLSGTTVSTSIAGFTGKPFIQHFSFYPNMIQPYYSSPNASEILTIIQAVVM